MLGRLVALAGLVGGATGEGGEPWDVVVYACTPAGFAAALGAKAAGAPRVLVLEPTAHVGGMAAAGGIGLRDTDQDQVRDNNSTQHTWGMRNARFYGVPEPVWQPDNWLGERTFKTMLAEAGVELRLNAQVVEGPAGLRLKSQGDSRVITALALEGATAAAAPTWIEARYVIDASYEGEIMIAAGCSFTFGRESRDQYGERDAGVTNTSADLELPISKNVSPFADPKQGGELLKYVQRGPDPRSHAGAADENLMAFSYRACLTSDPTNSVAVTPPPNYDPKDFEIARRFVLAELAAGGRVGSPWGDMAYRAYPSSKPMKHDACCGSGAVGIDAAGLAVGYANATRAQRKEIAEAHEYYVKGLMWFWRNDSAVPAALRAQHAALGLCKDEWPDNDHFPTQLYVREAARMVGDKVFTQNSRTHALEPNGCLADSIAIQSWGVDVHVMQRVVVPGTAGGSSKFFPFNEGHTPFDGPSNDPQGGNFFSELPYWIVLPKRKELANLAAPNVPSVSHVAFAGIREEPTLWQLGQAAGTAAGVALRGEGTVLHDVDVTALQQELLKQKTFIHWPPRDSCSAPMPPVPPPIGPPHKPPHPPPAPPGPVVHEACQASKLATITVSGAGSALNGVYKKTAATIDGQPVFVLDEQHQLYRDFGYWRLGQPGHGLFYVSTTGRADGPPSGGWQVAARGTAPPPNITCKKQEVREPSAGSSGALKLDDAEGTAPNGSDPTPVLQKLLDGGSSVSIGRMPGSDSATWLVRRPLAFTRSHQRVTFEQGTVIYAANDTFHGGKDSLFGTTTTNRSDPAAGLHNLSIIGYGAVWRMRRKDYAKTPSDKSNGWYTVSEDRAGLNLEGCTGVNIEGLTIAETGGDGIYINTAWDITLSRILIDGGYRNGISVIAVQQLLVEHSIVRNTFGTDPEAGLDIEPNPCVPGKCEHVNFINSVRFNNVTFAMNWGGGILLSLAGNLGNATMPITVRFDDCKVNGTGVSGPLSSDSSEPQPPEQPGRLGAGLGGANPNAVVISGIGAPYHNTGEIRFNDLSVANATGGDGLTIRNVPARGWATVIVDSLTVEGVGFDARSRPPTLSPINIFGSFDEGNSSDGIPTGGVKIINATVRDRSARPYLRVIDPNGFEGVEFTGRVSNPYGCEANVETGQPLADVNPTTLPRDELSIDVQCEHR